MRKSSVLNWRILVKVYSLSATQWVIGITIILLFTVAYGVLVLNKYWQFEYFYRDNVLFDSALWKVAEFKEPIIKHHILGEINILGDHFSLTIFSLSPLYRLFPTQEIILISMVILYGASAYLALLVGFKLLKSRLLTYALLIAYFLYLGTQNGFLYGFHDVYFAVFFFFLAIYGLVIDNRGLYWLGIVLLLLTKEGLAVVVVGVGWFILLSYPRKKNLGYSTIILAVVYFILVIRLVIPSFSGRFFYTEAGLPRNFAELFQALTVPSQKLTTIFVSVSSFAFLPLANIATLPLVLQDFFLRFVFATPGNVQYTLGYHYNVTTSALLLFSSIWSLHLLQKKKRLGDFLPLLALAILVATLYYHRFSNPRGPLGLVLNRQFYQITENNRFLWELVSRTPLKGKIMSQNHLGYALSHRDVFEMATHPQEFNKISPDYVVLDLRPGQNPNNFVPLTEERTREMSQLLLESGKYRINFAKAKMYILEKVKEDCDDFANPYCYFKPWDQKP